MTENNRDLILDQFTRQAERFARSPLVNAEHLLARMVVLGECGPGDLVLDAGSGPGVVACAFAPHVHHAVGVDLTGAMLAEARGLQAHKNLRNVSWVRGDVTALPFSGACFSTVVSRFVFHHLPDPAAAVREMARVCRTGGRIVAVDSAPAPEKAAAFNAMERLRDPSHAEAFPADRLAAFLMDAGFDAPHIEAMRLEGDLDGLLARSFPAEGDIARLRGIFENAIDDDRLDMALRRENGAILFEWPLAILSARKS